MLERTILDTILGELLTRTNITDRQAFAKFLNAHAAKLKLSGTIPSSHLSERYRMLVREGKLPLDARVKRLLRRRAVRSLSGVSVVSLLTKPWSCPGKCVYCPTNPGLPKSYIPNEPAVQRAELNLFDPLRQVYNRLRALEMTGHDPEKCDVRIIWGTWSVYPESYRREFITHIFDAHTTFPEASDASSGIQNVANTLPLEYSEELDTSEGEADQTDVKNDGAEKKFLPFFLPKSFTPKLSLSLEEAQKRNETATNRIIGIAVETRPDCLDTKEIKLLREYGVTRIEIGYQTTIDEINIATGRGHANAESIAATKMLKDAGFKVVCHMMPGLPGSNPDLDRKSFARVWEDPDFRPDEVKIYPAVGVGNSEMANMYARGEFQPYSDEVLIPLMAELQSMIPRYVRLNRSYRDIPASEILAGSKRANLRQLTESSLQEKHLAIVDISHREVRDKKNDRTHAEVRVIEYEASEGREYFIELIDPSDDTLFGHCRLRIPSSYFAKVPHFLTSLEGTAIIRELHVFGDQMRIGETGGVSQHRGFGTELLTTTENIIREKYPDIHRIAVIAGIGVREYYRKFGYETGEDGYVFKNISL